MSISNSNIEKRINLPINKKSILQLAILLIILLLGFGIRVYDLSDPPLFFHPTRQLRTLLISRAAYYRMDPSIDPGLRQQAMNLATLEVYEPPILENLIGFIYLLIGGEKFWIGRIVNAVFWTLGGLFLYLFGKRFFRFGAVITGLLFYFSLPFSVIASRSLQPDPWMVVWIIASIYTIYMWAEKKTWKWAIISGIVGGITVLVKGFAALYVVPVFASVFLTNVKVKALIKNKHIWIITGLVILPSFLYYLVLNPGRSSDFLSFWVVSLSGMILTTEFYADWLAMIKGLMGLGLFLTAILGLMLAPKKIKPVLVGGWIGYVIFGLIFPYQYVTHEYYHLALIPLVALSLMPIVQIIFDKLATEKMLWRICAVCAILFSSAYSLYVSRSIMYANNYASEPIAWKNVGEAIPPNSPFIALTADYGMRLRYYGWRIMSASWPNSSDLNLFALAGNDPINYENYFNEVADGMDYFVITAFNELDAQPALRDLLTNHYQLYSEGDGYIIYDLNSKIS